MNTVDSLKSVVFLCLLVLVIIMSDECLMLTRSKEVKDFLTNLSGSVDFR